MSYRDKWQKALIKRAQISDGAILTGLSLSYYADWNTGKNCRPGNAKLMDDRSISLATVKRHMEALRDDGWVTRVADARTARRRGWVDEYELSIPEHGSGLSPTMAQSCTDHGSGLSPTMAQSCTDHGSPGEPYTYHDLSHNYISSSGPALSGPAADDLFNHDDDGVDLSAHGKSPEMTLAQAENIRLKAGIFIDAEEIQRIINEFVEKSWDFLDDEDDAKRILAWFDDWHWHQEWVVKESSRNSEGFWRTTLNGSFKKFYFRKRYRAAIDKQGELRYLGRGRPLQDEEVCWASAEALGLREYSTEEETLRANGLEESM